MPYYAAQALDADAPRSATSAGGPGGGTAQACRRPSTSLPADESGRCAAERWALCASTQNRRVQSRLRDVAPRLRSVVSDAASAPAPVTCAASTLLPHATTAFPHAVVPIARSTIVVARTLPTVCACPAARPALLHVACSGLAVGLSRAAGGSAAPSRPFALEHRARATLFADANGLRGDVTLLREMSQPVDGTSSA